MMLYIGERNWFRFIGLLAIVSLIIACLLLQSACTTMSKPEWCQSGVSFFFSAADPYKFDAFLNGDIIASGLTFEQVKECGK